MITNSRSDNVNTRNLVVDILLAVTRDGAFSHIAIRDVLDKYRYLPKQDRAFITRLSQGTIERMIELDAIINQFSKTKVKKMKPVIAAILRSGVYQLKYMDSVPDSAACNEAVKLTVKRGFGGLKGFVNGVMRTIARNMDQIRKKNRCGICLSNILYRNGWCSVLQSSTGQKPVSGAWQLILCRIRPQCRWIQIGVPWKKSLLPWNNRELQ